MLLVFAKDDAQCDAIYWAAKRGSYKSTIARSSEAALTSYQEEQHDLVIIDARSPKLIDYDGLCR